MLYYEGASQGGDSGMLKVEKRNGLVVDFETEKIAIAVKKAMNETEKGVDEELANSIGENAVEAFGDKEKVNIEEIQDYVEIELMKSRPEVARKYIIYREERARLREQGWNMTDLQRDIYEKKYRYDAKHLMLF